MDRVNTGQRWRRCDTEAEHAHLQVLCQQVFELLEELPLNLVQLGCVRDFVADPRLRQEVDDAEEVLVGGLVPVVEAFGTRSKGGMSSSAMK